MRINFAFFAALMLWLAAMVPYSPALAWSHGSHMTTGAIAFDDLISSDPALVDELDRIITAHPHHDRLAEKAAGLSGPDRTRMMLQWLARWPDDIRDTSFDCYECHYELRVVSGWTWLWPFRNGQASEAFDQHYATLANPDAPLRERAIAIAWIMHIVGDIQQPLHAGHRLNAQFLQTDRAGLIAFVRRVADAEPTTLHDYWDHALDLAGPPAATASFWATRLQMEFPRYENGTVSYAGSMQMQFSNWLDESMHLARLVAYQGTALTASDEDASAPVFNPLENRVTVELSKRRVVAGGYRIADVFRAALR